MALFLDLDGTLAPIEATPALVLPTQRRTRLLAGLTARFGGAVAILSGRTIEEIDRILEDGCTAVSGVHGLTRRTTEGGLIKVLPSHRLDQARIMLGTFAEAHPGLVLEDKVHSLALHYRNAPETAEAVWDVCARLAELDELTVQQGHMVCELRTPGPDKGDSLRAFLSAAPFAGRAPIMVGDDLTDEHGFVAASEHGGFGVLVGPGRRTAARYALSDVEGVLEWLETALGTPS